VPYVYILRSVNNGRYYIGCTEDLGRRLREHNDGKGSSTKAFRPWELAHSQYFNTLTQARQRESYLKAQKSRAVLTKLVAGD
jgi:putative endonuclease